jgi:hypothetical protein
MGEKENYYSYRPFEEFLKKYFKEKIENSNDKKLSKKFFNKEGKKIKK